MSEDIKSTFNRRIFLGAGAAALSGLAAPALAQSTGDTVEIERDLSQVVRRNISSFRSLRWQPYFDTPPGWSDPGRYNVARAALLVAGSVASTSCIPPVYR